MAQGRPSPLATCPTRLLIGHPLNWNLATPMITVPFLAQRSPNYKKNPEKAIFPRKKEDKWQFWARKSNFLEFLSPGASISGWMEVRFRGDASLDLGRRPAWL